MNPDEEEGIKDEYMTIAKVLAPHVDFLLCETLSCIREAVPAAEAARSTGRQTVSNKMKNSPNKWLIMINCPTASFVACGMMKGFLKLLGYKRKSTYNCAEGNLKFDLY